MWWAELLNNLAALYDSGVPLSTNSYESIATVNVGVLGASTITFSSIPSTYKHLQIRAIVRSNYLSSSNQNAYIQFNGDTAANYSYHELTGQGSTAGAGGSANVTGPRIINYATTVGLANTFGVGVVDILDYADTNKYKTYRSLNGNDQNGSGYVILFSGNWRSTSAISSIVIGDNGGGTFQQYSSFALYGVKG